VWSTLIINATHYLFLLILSRHKPLFVVPSLQSEIVHSVPSLQSGPFSHSQERRVTHRVWVLCFLTWAYYEFFNLFLEENTLPAEGKSKVASHTPLYLERGPGVSNNLDIVDPPRAAPTQLIKYSTYQLITSSNNHFINLSLHQLLKSSSKKGALALSS
jgi:hypothetical protein